MRLIRGLWLPLALVLQGVWANMFPLSYARLGQMSKASLDTENLAAADADIEPTLLYPAHNFSFPVDHFHNESMYEPHSDAMFDNRYWFDDTYYKPGGPVFLLICGEISATERLPIMQKGIIYQLSQAFGGMSVVIEHRYFGTSIPTPDLSTPNMRFATTDQTLEDVVDFAQNIVFQGHETENLTAISVPWVTYGGSYSGAFVAFLRTLYPGVFWGSISSSGVTEAIYDYWEYYEPIRQYGPQPCIEYTQNLTNVVDNILLGNTPNMTYASAMGNTSLISQLKGAFGLTGITYDNDFAQTIGQSLGYWQNRNWDPAVNDPTFSYYCGNLSANSTLYPVSPRARLTATSLLAAGGYASQTSTLLIPMLNYIGFINVTFVQPCAAKGMTQDQCFSTHNQTYYDQDDLSQTWRSWPYMYCTQWGYLQTGSGVSQDQLPLISRTIDLDYLSIICRDAFNISTPPDTMAINQYGGYDIAYPRLALIGGEADPWRPATPLAPEAQPWNRPNDMDQPFLLISGAVHHWDENGLFPNETTPDLPPGSEKLTQGQEHDVVAAWLREAVGQFPGFNLSIGY